MRHRYNKRVYVIKLECAKSGELLHRSQNCIEPASESSSRSQGKKNRSCIRNWLHLYLKHINSHSSCSLKITLLNGFNLHRISMNLALKLTRFPEGITSLFHGLHSAILPVCIKVSHFYFSQKCTFTYDRPKPQRLAHQS